MGGRGDRCPQSGQVQKGPAGAGRGRGESQACFPHLNTEHLSGQLKLEENLSVVNRNRNIIQLLPQSENTEVATRWLQNPLSFLILRTYSSSSNLDVSFGFLCVSMTVLKLANSLEYPVEDPERKRVDSVFKTFACLFVL